MNQIDIKWDQQMRFRLIEIIAQWEGRLTTNHLCDAFRIGRQQASRDINKYLNLTDREQLILDRTIRGYRPADDFKPLFTQGTAHEYLTMLHQQYNLEETFEFFSWGEAQSTVLNVPERVVAPKIVRGLIAAARANLRVDIDYVSLSTPEIRGRIIAPHSLIYDGIRWHVRAYCEEKSEFRDFVLSRFRNEPDLMDKSPKTREHDDDWNHQVKVTITPNPHLSEKQQCVVAEDYAMENHKLTIITRKALVHYCLRRMGVTSDEKLLRAQPEMYQLTVSSEEGTNNSSHSAGFDSYDSSRHSTEGMSGHGEVE
ncbi:WYL domain-containing protein [Vibrio cholerae]|uniref:WYL domain-containing protein n=1 Tax=Vibrio TaxID=662 RepID=UPI00155E8AB1|nr:MULTISPECIES: WYL domain-containing protein [Vibrio]EGQ9854195.1 WYL domain-containing protein [Vibrio cholerae]EGR3959771.1 WYL domain-containing protein [Vibrio cholerae]ELJ8533920.1 WYL domain-containing protein [Vibrio cholerae]MBL4287755.1 WYL domain-containing protein [Vibrio fluvialis]MBL4292126.1 WYL domain-containing protein [Vibrio fluvialis]